MNTRPETSTPPPATVIPATEDGDENPNEETHLLLERLEAGTEPLYGPFDSVEEMFAALDAPDPA